MRLAPRYGLVNLPIKPLDEKDFCLWFAVLPRSTHISWKSNVFSQVPAFFRRSFQPFRYTRQSHSGFFPDSDRLLVSCQGDAIFFLISWPSVVSFSILQWPLRPIRSENQVEEMPRSTGSSWLAETLWYACCVVTRSSHRYEGSHYSHWRSRESREILKLTVRSAAPRIFQLKYFPPRRTRNTDENMAVN